jgi:hypothetical protein
MFSITPTLDFPHSGSAMYDWAQLTKDALQHLGAESLMVPGAKLRDAWLGSVVRQVSMSPGM